MLNQRFFIFYWKTSNQKIFHSFVWKKSQIDVFFTFFANSAFFHKNIEWKHQFSNFSFFLYENLPIQRFFFTEKNANVHIIEKCQIGNLASFNMWKTANSVFLLIILLKKSCFHINCIEKTPNYNFFHLLYEKIGNFFRFSWKSSESAPFLIILLKKYQISFFFTFYEKNIDQFFILKFF